MIVAKQVVSTKERICGLPCGRRPRPSSSDSTCFAYKLCENQHRKYIANQVARNLREKKEDTRKDRKRRNRQQSVLFW